MNDIDRLIERPRLYHNIDGNRRTGAGFMALSFSLLGWLQLTTPPDAAWHRLYVAAPYTAAAISIIHFGTRWLKRRITWPRTGYVEYRARATRRPAMIFGALCAVAVIAGMRLAWDNAALLFGLLFAAAYARGVAGTARWKWIVAAAIACASLAVAALRDLSGGLAARFWLSVALYGALLLVSGGITLYLYLRRTQPPAREDR